jgi:lipopolysaccharide cholinephosphotransferase
MVDLKIQLPDDFFKEEVRCGYTITKDMKQLWAVQLDLLHELDRVCKLHNLKYFAIGGTLLGAVRHKGYIPWDDDIDVVMLRDDYEKLCKIAKESFAPEYFFQNAYTDNLVRKHAQLRRNNTTCFILNDYKKPYHRGIFIDIFILDSIPDSIEGQRKLKQKLKTKNFLLDKPNFPYYMVLEQNKIMFQNPIKYVIKLALYYPKMVLYYFLNLTHQGRINRFRKYDELAQSYRNSGSDCCTNILFYSTRNIDYRIHSAKAYQNPITLPFEGTTILAPNNYDEILTSHYGDYHKFKMGGSIHGCLYWDCDNDYSTYDSLTRNEFLHLFK